MDFINLIFNEKKFTHQTGFCCSRDRRLGIGFSPVEDPLGSEIGLPVRNLKNKDKIKETKINKFLN